MSSVELVYTYEEMYISLGGQSMANNEDDNIIDETCKRKSIF